MESVVIKTEERIGTLKPMHAVNNGPHIAGTDQVRGNGKEYAAARIPYARTHDAAFSSKYGGEHTVDMYAIFPDFDADVNDPASYDFAMTDQYYKEILSVGTEVFHRFGVKIEHGIKKYHIWPPKDYQKWAEICEHIIMHYNEGWADGFHYNLQYWEIWNEPDLDEDEKPMHTHRTWAGTSEQFFEFYRVVALHLKKRFPHLKIGGPSMARYREGWFEDFMKAMTTGERVPFDFYSWHIYTAYPQKIFDRAVKVRAMLDRYGYTDTESILNEWNYVRGWTDDFVYSVETVIGAKGAAFTAACMAGCQNGPVDMLMYYDARACAFNGLFDFYTLRPLKGYYPFYLFAELYELRDQVSAASDDSDVYVLAAADDTTARTMISYYSEDDTAAEKEVSLTVDRSGTYSIALTDADVTMERSTVELTAGVPHTFRLKPQSILYLETKKETR